MTENPPADLYEWHVCCVKPRRCTDDHFHERDVVRMIAKAITEERQRISLAIEAERDRRHVGPGGFMFGSTEPFWMSDEPLTTAARIARGESA